MMIPTRRSFLITLLSIPWAGLAWAKSIREDKLAIAMGQETAGSPVSVSDRVKLDAPDIAEDGSIVPISIASELPDTESIWVFVEKNPTPLAARFDLATSLEPFVSLRIKMNESCTVVALIKSGDEYFSASKAVRVVLGGCG